MPPIVFAILQCILVVAFALTVWRVFVGPSVPDRVIAFDLFASIVVAQLVLAAAFTKITLYLEIAIAIAVLSFLATVALAQYLESRQTRELD